MMMVSSAKLRKTQNTIQNLSLYERKLSQLMDAFLQEEKEFHSPFTEQRTVKRIAIVAFSSDSGLVGRFNHNITDALQKVVARYRDLGNENILIYAFGEKVATAAQRMGFTLSGDYRKLSAAPSYDATRRIAEEWMDDFLRGKIDRVELIYHHFVNKGNQRVVQEPFLPIELNRGEEQTFPIDYIVEPDKKTILLQLVHKVLTLKLFTTHLDSVTAEHAARMTAMQIATDNADDLTEELNLEYNKLRQQSITNELLDIVGGSFGNNG